MNKDLKNVITAQNIALIRHGHCRGENSDEGLYPMSQLVLTDLILPTLLQNLIIPSRLTKVVIFHSPEVRALHTAQEVETTLTPTGFQIELQAHRGLRVDSNVFSERFMTAEQEFESASFAIFVTHGPVIQRFLRSEEEPHYLATFGENFYMPGHR